MSREPRPRSKKWPVAPAIPKADAIQNLTPREKQVLAFIGQGFGDREIAVMLARSENTIATHAHRIHFKLQTCSRAHLVLTAVAHGLHRPSVPG